MFGKKEQIITQLETPDVREKTPYEKKIKKKNAEKRPNFFKRVLKWLRELRSELKKVVWLTRQQVVSNTVIVLVCIAIVGVCLWIFDYIASQGASALIYAFNR